MKNPRPATGFILHEAIMALGLAMALAVGVAQILVLVGHQRRLACQSTIAAEEAGNLMEKLVARAWNETTAERVSQIGLSEECRRKLPDAKLHIQISTEAPDARRIDVQIDWRDPSGPRGAPVRLVGWKFRDREDQP